MRNESSTSHTHTQKLSAEIKKIWAKLTDEEIGFQASNPSKFFDAVKAKYSINKDEAEKTVKQLDAACKDGSSKDSCHASDTASKASNDTSSSAKPAPKAANA